MTRSIINDTKRAEIKQEILNRIDELVNEIDSAINATSENTRKSTVNLVIRVGHQKDDPLNIEIVQQIKRKTPRTDYSDLTSWGDVETVAVVRLGEEPGQQKLEVN